MTAGAVTPSLPLLGLRITAGPVELRGITDDLLGPLAELAMRGIHDEGSMPFETPWTRTTDVDMPRQYAQFHWRVRADFSVEKWLMPLAVLWEGQLAGTQGLTARNYLVTRTGVTGSWLGREFQGRGIGTAMRQVMCAFAFDCLDAECITSSANMDNPASLAVSRKVGYQDNGLDITCIEGKSVESRRFILKPADLIRFPQALTVIGLPEFRHSIGLPDE